MGMLLKAWPNINPASSSIYGIYRQWAGLVCQGGRVNQWAYLERHGQVLTPPLDPYMAFPGSGRGLCAKGAGINSDCAFVGGANP